MKKPLVCGVTAIGVTRTKQLSFFLVCVCEYKDQFAHIDAGRVRSVGDAYAYRRSGLKTKTDAEEWLNFTQS